MEVWFFFDEGTTGREPQMSGEETERIYTRAPPKRVGRALALLTKTYHGSRVTVHLKQNFTFPIDAITRSASRRPE
jgi:hypothetical protein